MASTSVVLGPVYTEKYRALHKSGSTVSQVKSKAEQDINSDVKALAKRWKLDLAAVSSSVAVGSVVPLSGLLIMVPEVIFKCVKGGIKLGLVPLLSARDLNDLHAMIKQSVQQIKDASKAGLIAAFETVVLEVAKQLKIGDWLWQDVLKEVLTLMVEESLTTAIPGAALILAGVKWVWHRHSIKKMFQKLGARAIIMHGQWIDQNLTAQATQTTPSPHSDGQFTACSAPTTNQQQTAPVHYYSYSPAYYSPQVQYNGAPHGPVLGVPA